MMMMTMMMIYKLRLRGCSVLEALFYVGSSLIILTLEPCTKILLFQKFS